MTTGWRHLPLKNARHAETQLPAHAGIEMVAAAHESHPGQVRALRYRYYGYYSNRSRGARREAENQLEDGAGVVIDDAAPNSRRKANLARLIQKVYEIDPLECPNCGATMRIIALIDDADVVERILTHLKVWDPIPDPITPADPVSPWPKGDTLFLSYHPVPDII